MTALVSKADALAYLRKNAPEIAAILEKDMTAADVHQTTALGNGKAKNFQAMLAEAKTKKAPVAKDAQADVEWSGTFKMAKADADKQLVFGWASITHRDGELVVDKQDDVITSEDLEAGAYDFVLYCREQGDMHVRKGCGKLIESTVFTAEKMEKCGLFAFDVVTGEQVYGWWCGFYTDDAGVWKRIKDGELPEFSIGGSGKRVPI